MTSTPRLYCPHCRARIDAGDLQCDRCGEILSGRRSSLHEAGRAAAAPADRRGRRVWGVDGASGSRRWSGFLFNTLATLAVAACVLLLGALVHAFAPDVLASLGAPPTGQAAPSAAQATPPTASGSAVSQSSFSHASSLASSQGTSHANRFAARRSTPESAAGSLTISGEIFEFSRYGAAPGTKIQLVRAQDFEPLFQEVVQLMRERETALQILLRLKTLLHDRDALDTQLQKREPLIALKTTEIQNCRTQRWSQFTYVDPLTDTSSPRKYISGVAKADESTIRHMETRLAALRRHVTSLKQERSNLDPQIQAQVATLRRSLPQVSSQGTPDQVLASLRRYLRGIDSSPDLHTHTSTDLIQALDAATVDTTHANKRGHFEFPQKRHDSYLVYANVGPATWLVPVPWNPDQTPRPLILAPQNTLNLEEQLKHARAGNLTVSLNQLVGGS